jgi:hypothetical protein
MTYWVISQRITRDISVGEAIRHVLQNQAAIVYGDMDFHRAQVFVNKVQRNDWCILARGRGDNKKLLACGVIGADAMEAPDMPGFLMRRLLPFVDLRINGEEATPDQHGLNFEEAKYGRSSIPPAIFELDPTRNEADAAICAFFDRMVESGSHSPEGAGDS